MVLEGPVVRQRFCLQPLHVLYGLFDRILEHAEPLLELIVKVGNFLLVLFNLLIVLCYLEPILLHVLL